MDEASRARLQTSEEAFLVAGPGKDELLSSILQRDQSHGRVWKKSKEFSVGESVRLGRRRRGRDPNGRPGFDGSLKRDGCRSKDGHHCKRLDCPAPPASSPQNSSAGLKDGFAARIALFV